MKLLFDTNTLIYWAEGRGLSAYAKRLLFKPSTQAHISILTPWEIATKASKVKRWTVSQERVRQVIAELAAEVVPLKLEHITAYSQLPYIPGHDDPFDRMIISQAMVEGLPIVSSDSRFPEYKSIRVLW